MTDTIEIVREIAKQFAEQTNHRIDQTNKAIETLADQNKELSNQMGRLAEAITTTNEQLVRYEERQTTAMERMERLDQTQKEQGIIQRQFEEKTNDRFTETNQHVRDNSHIRTVIVWLVGIILTAAIGGGVLFGDFTGKGRQNAPQQQSNSVP
jgi:chromosome segregation ATPase